MSQTFCNRTYSKKKKKVVQLFSGLPETCLCVYILQQMCTQWKPPRSTKVPQWGGSKWMHDKAEQTDRLISFFTCYCSSSLYNYAIIYCAWFISLHDSFTYQEVVVRLNGIQSETALYLHGNNKMVIWHLWQMQGQRCGIQNYFSLPVCDLPPSSPLLPPSNSISNCQLLR